MTFTEACSSGRDFRRVGDNQSWFGFDVGDGLREYFPDGGKSSYPSFQMKDFMTGEFEFVEQEIGVGDEIVLNQSVGAYHEGTICDVTEVCPNEVPIGKIKVRPRTVFYLGDAQYTLVKKALKETS